MRTDVKIGIAVGLFVVVVAVVYFIVADRGQDADKPAPTRVAKVEPKPDRPGGIVGFEVPASPRPIPPSVIVPVIEPPPLIPPRASMPVAPAVPEGPILITPLPPGAPTRVPPPSLVPEGPGEVAVTVPRLTPSPAPGVAVVAGGEREYVVQAGDAGFWAVAQKVYGDGRNWTLIARANPTAESNALRVGQKLRIPPLPREPARTEGVPPAPAAGEPGIYVVQAGDAGFWGVAQKVYGDGRHWTHVAKANPDVNSSALRIGQRLKVPPLPEPVAPAVTPSVEPAPAPGASRRTHTVQAGESGFWGVAQKVYGDGRHWTLIANANPGVDPQRLRVGQTLVIPELTEEVRSSAVRPTRATGPRETVSAGSGYVRPPAIRMGG